MLSVSFFEVGFWVAIPGAGPSPQRDGLQRTAFVDGLRVQAGQATPTLFLPADASIPLQRT